VGFFDIARSHVARCALAFLKRRRSTTHDARASGHLKAVATLNRPTCAVTQVKLNARHESELLRVGKADAGTSEKGANLGGGGSLGDGPNDELFEHVLRGLLPAKAAHAWDSKVFALRIGDALARNYVDPGFAEQVSSLSVRHQQRVSNQASYLHCPRGLFARYTFEAVQYRP
jgi:hypothetical protein